MNEKISYQYGFRPQRCTIDLIANLAIDICNAFKESETTTALFFNLEKAFDILSRQTIITNLSNMGISGSIFYFIRNYLTDRALTL